MKTPKRNNRNGYGAAYCPYEGPTQTAFEHARWKRKNRVAQLKRTIRKYKCGEGLFNERSHLKSAYIGIQMLGELKPSSSLAECRGHLLLVEGIIKTLRWEQEKALRIMENIIDRREENDG